MKKINIKGFTLVELLAVVALLAIISIVVVSTLINQFTDVKSKLNEGQVDLIKSGAKSYVNDNVDNYPKKVGNNYCVRLNTLIKEGYLSDDLIDAINDNKIDNTFGVKIEVESEIGYEYKFDSVTDVCYVPLDD